MSPPTKRRPPSALVLAVAAAGLVGGILLVAHWFLGAFLDLLRFVSDIGVY